VLDDALTGLQPIPRVIELDRRQPESVQTLEQYLATRLTATKIENGRKRLADNAALLARVEQRLQRPAALHRGALGHGVRLRPLHGRLLDRRVAGHARA
jgi:membrane-bound lytic murein transglycosylase B